MQSRPLVIITTRLSPQICGVGTFSWLLHRHWPEDAAEHQFLVVDGAADSCVTLGYRKISQFNSEWAALGHALEEAGSTNVLLHYAGRGYNRFGCPVGLPSVLRKWKTCFPQARLVIFFHELPGPLPITSPHYWLNVCNRWVVRKLANTADAVVTNTAEHARTLEKLSHHANISWLPVPSNIEPRTSIQEKRTSSEFVIFGLPFSRWQTLQTFDSDIRRWQEKNTLTRLHLIGPPDDQFDHRSEELMMSYARKDMVVRHHELPAEQVSRLLSQLPLALTTANESNWSKSATLMAYFAHRCNVIVKRRPASEPLCWAVKVTELDTISQGEMKARADAARRWYESNADWKVFASKIWDLFQKLAT